MPGDDVSSGVVGLNRGAWQAGPQACTPRPCPQSQWVSESSGLVHFGPFQLDATVGGTAVVLPSGQARGEQAGGAFVQLMVNRRLTDEAEGGGIINAHPPCSRFAALCTLGDGQCLCHAASLGVWGVHDRDRALRSALQESMASELAQGQLRRRFFHQLCKVSMGSGSTWRHPVAGRCISSGPGGGGEGEGGRRGREFGGMLRVPVLRKGRACNPRLPGPTSRP